MERTHKGILKGLVGAGVRWRYGEKADNLVKRRIVWELMHIIDAGFVDYYLMAFWVFKYSKQGINYWARGAVPSSIVCYCLGLTEVDPIKYGLHSARFVNDEPPKFQFDIETLRYNEFMKRAEEVLQANAKDFDIPAIRECLFKDVKPYEYLNKKQERPLPTGLEDEFARYALYFPQTMDLFRTYVNQYPNCNLLIYQEQMGELTGIQSIKHLLSLYNSLFALILAQELARVEDVSLRELQPHSCCCHLVGLHRRFCFKVPGTIQKYCNHYAWVLVVSVLECLIAFYGIKHGIIHIISLLLVVELASNSSTTREPFDVSYKIILAILMSPLH